MPRISYVNGMYVPHNDAAVHIEDRGFQFADSVYEVIAFVDGKLADERGHLDRLTRSLAELRMKLPVSRRALRFILRETVRRNRITNAGIYIQVTRGVSARDFKIPTHPEMSLVITVRPASFDIDKRKSTGKKVITIPDIRWQRRDIKTTALLAQSLAKQQALDAGADDAWMVDEKDYVTEASSSNAWIVDARGNLITRPAKGNAILKGVTRSTVQALAEREKIKIIERAFTVKEALAAKEAFMSSAVALFVPVVAIDGHKIGDGKAGATVAKLYDIYMEYAEQRSKEQQWQPN